MFYLTPKYIWFINFSIFCVLFSSILSSIFLFLFLNFSHDDKLALSLSVFLWWQSLTPFDLVSLYNLQSHHLGQQVATPSAMTLSRINTTSAAVVQDNGLKSPADYIMPI